MIRSLSRSSRCAATLFLFLLSFASASYASEAPLASIRYRLGMSRPVSHLFEVQIEAELAEGSAAEYLDFQMPRWSPGRYSVFDFAKNVQQVQAIAGICPPDAMCAVVGRRVTRLDDQTWRVWLEGVRSMTLSYRVFADDLSGTFSQLDERHANFNGGSVFMYVVGHKQDPVKLSITPPRGWRIINGASRAADQREFSFANYDLLIDTPTEVAPDWTMEEFKVDGKTYRVVVHSFGDEGGKRPQLVRDVEKIVRAQVSMWGAPEFDTYTFMYHFANDNRSIDGMEHLDSTNMILPGKLADPAGYDETLEMASHEFFHVWNVKRLRPIELGPWDFTRPVATRGLWIAEGVTQYYGELLLGRAGLWPEKKLLEKFGQTISGIEASAGSRLMSAEESSLVAPFLDGGSDVQRTNLNNTSVSYYYKGEVLAFVLDLLIRKRTQGRRSLDDVLRRMYEELYVKSPSATYYLRGRGFTSEDFERATSEVVGADMSDFFKRYVRGVETPPYDEALAGVGLQLVRELSPSPSIGVSPDYDEQTSMKVGNVRNDSPAEDAGLKKGDIILAVGDTNVTRQTFTPAVLKFKPNDRVPFTINRDGSTRKVVITFGAPTSYSYRLEELKDAAPDTRARRAAWLGPASNRQLAESGRQKAEGRKQKAVGERQSVVGSE